MTPPPAHNLGVAVLSLSGSDAARFLHGQSTQDIQSISIGEVRHAFVLTPKGKILAEFHVCRSADTEFLLVTSSDRAEFLGVHLKKYILRQSVVIEPIIQRHGGFAHDPTVGATPCGRPRVDPHVSTTECIEITKKDLGESEWLVFAFIGDQAEQAARAALPTAYFFRRHGHVACLVQASAWNALEVDVARAIESLAVSSEEVLERHRILNGVPIYGREFDEANLPQETGLLDCLHFNKGCYTGQEIVARLHFRGHVTKCLAQLEIQVSDLAESDVRALRFAIGEKEVSPMTSVIRVHDDIWRGFIYLPYAFFESLSPNELLVSQTPNVSIVRVQKIEITS